MNRIEDQEAYDNIRNYRNELRDEFDNPSFAMRWVQIDKLRNRIKELDELLMVTEKENPDFISNYSKNIRDLKYNPGTT